MSDTLRANDRMSVWRRFWPRPKTWLALLAGSLALVSLFGAFEAGQILSGYGGFFSSKESLENAALTAKLHQVEAQLAAAETARMVDRATYAAVERSQADIQALLDEQRQELSFYRSIVRPGGGIFGVHIQRLQVLPSLAPRHYRVRLVLSQASRDSKPATATADFVVIGMQGGHSVSLPLAKIGTTSRVLSFTFRYFEEVETEIELPGDFVPQRVQVEVRNAQRGGPVRQSFIWKLEVA
jgi:hypothetical protein